MAAPVLCVHRVNRTNRQCRNRALPGRTLCAKHGGTASQIVNAAQRRAAQATLYKLGAALSVERPNQDPGEALLEEVSRCAWAVRWCEAIIADLPQAEFVQALERVDHDAGPGSALTFAEVRNLAQPSAWVQIYWNERDRLARVCKVALQVGLAERTVRLAENQGQLMASLVTALIEDLAKRHHWGPADVDEARRAAAHHLKLLPAS